VEVIFSDYNFIGDESVPGPLRALAGTAASPSCAATATSPPSARARRCPPSTATSCRPRVSNCRKKGCVGHATTPTCGSASTTTSSSNAPP
jgi:hypothetical protein